LILLHAILSPPPCFSFSISSTLTLPMAKDGIYNTNDHSHNNARKPPCLE
jgi:hypothetical protein